MTLTLRRMRPVPSADVVAAMAFGRADINVVALTTPPPDLDCLREPFISLEQGAA